MLARRCLSLGRRAAATPLPRRAMAVLEPRRVFSYLSTEYEFVRKAETPEEEAISNLLYNVPKDSGESRPTTLTALLSNEPGVLSRVTGTLAGRGYNISSLVVCATEVAQISRATLVINASEIRQVKRDLEDIVQVWAVVEYRPTDSLLEREMLMVKVNANPPGVNDGNPVFAGGAASRYQQSAADIIAVNATRQSIVELTKLFGGKILDLTNETVTIELTAKQARVDAFLKLVRPFGIVESARSGPMAMMRGAFSGFEAEQKTEKESSVSLSDLPPG